MRTELLERLKKYNRAHDWLETNGFEPVGVYGKYVVITVDGEKKDYKTFIDACNAINPDWDNKILATPPCAITGKGAMTKITLQELENKTIENLNRLTKDIESLNNNATIDNATKIRCLERRFGEYCGFFKILVLLNQDKAAELSGRNRATLNKAIEFTAKIYHLGEQQ